MGETRAEGEEEALRDSGTDNGKRDWKWSLFRAGFPLCMGIGGPGAGGAAGQQDRMRTELVWWWWYGAGRIDKWRCKWCV